MVHVVSPEVEDVPDARAVEPLVKLARVVGTLVRPLFRHDGHPRVMPPLIAGPSLEVRDVPHGIVQITVSIVVAFEVALRLVEEAAHAAEQIGTAEGGVGSVEAAEARTHGERRMPLSWQT